jgi:hypothetical protein
MSRNRRIALAAGIVASLLIVALVALHIAARALRPHIESALGPRATIGAIDAGLTGIELRDVRIAAAPGWPAKDELRAASIRITPDLRSLFGGPWRIARVRVDGGYVSALRPRKGGLRLLPALTERGASSPKQGGKPATVVEIGNVQLDDATFEFFDASVRQPALNLRLQRLRAEAGPIVVPALDREITLALEGVLDGPQHDGRLSIDGTLTPATRDARLKARFAGVDMVPLQPYLLKNADTRIQRGTLDLKLDATVARGKLQAPGRLTLTDLQLADGGPLATFAGVPRRAVLAAMTERGRLEVSFTLEGRLEDPSFSLNENLATKVTAGMAESLGVSLSGAVQGVGSVVKGLFGR